MSDLPCSCYKVPGLKFPVLETCNVSYLEDRYTLGAQIGWGQFGRIRSCIDMLTGETLACKSIAKDRLVSLDDLRSVLLEIQVMARLSGHPNVVDLKAVYEDEISVHLVMELCAGGELFYRLEKHGRFPEREASVLFRHFMEVVSYCHDKGVIHRDLKPENILLATKSSSSPIKLADFGLATYIQPGQFLYGIVGSPFYIAPEVLAGGYNQAADVWSAGVILYILLSGMPPFWGKTKSRIFDAVRCSELRFPPQPWEHVSETARDLISRMLCRDPSRRLAAKQVLEHPWLKEYSHEGLDLLEHHSSESSDPGECARLASLRCSFTGGARDLSFDFRVTSPVITNSQLGDTSLVSSSISKLPFSSYILDTQTPCFPSTSFSFCSSNCENEEAASSSMLGLTPSFSFFRASSSEEEVNLSNHGTSRKVSISGESDKNPPSKSTAGVGAGLTVASLRTMGVPHKKRNRTIGLGEFEQLDVVVSESFIRWASCTLLQTPSSLRLSLVC